NSTPASSTVPEAGTLPNCIDPNSGRASVVVMTGSSNFPPLLAKLSPLILGASGPTPVFLTTNSCTGVKSVVNSAPIGDPDAGAVSTKYAQCYDMNGVANPCVFGPGVQVQPDIGESDIFAGT